jgi:MYXO-CTERM domain-containing protein
LGPGGAEFDPSLGKFGGYRVTGILDGLADNQQDMDGRLTLLVLADELLLPDGKKQNMFTLALGGPDTTLFVLDSLALGVPVVGPGDANYDGQVDLTDFGLLKAGFGVGTKWGQGNFDGLGVTDLSDFGILKENFGKIFGQAAVPEPTSLGLAGLALLALPIARRRRRPSSNRPRAT